MKPPARPFSLRVISDHSFDATWEDITQGERMAPPVIALYFVDGEPITLEIDEDGSRSIYLHRSNTMIESKTQYTQES